MERKYDISGMSCNGCRAHVQQTLSTVPGVSKVSVDLPSASAIIESDKDVSLEHLQAALEAEGGGYGIHPEGQKPISDKKKV